MNAHRVKYLVVGDIPSAYTLSRARRKDLDILVKADPANAQVVFAALAEFGAPLSGMTPADFAEPGPFFRMGRAPIAIDILCDRRCRIRRRVGPPD